MAERPGIEDYQFYEHGGIDPKAILGPSSPTSRRGVKEGGSTISQQSESSPTNAPTRSAGRCEPRRPCSSSEVPKDTILELYLNEIYLGHGAYGLEAAAETYFDSHAGRLTLAQSAMLAGMISNPTLYDPVTDPEDTLSRRNVVLAVMLEHDLIDQEQYDKARAQPLRIDEHADEPKETKQALFVQFVRKLISEDVDGQFDMLGKNAAQRERALFQGGLSIYTTINPAWQAKAVGTIRDHLR
jgi:penicillin-binding protein 1A